MGCNDSVDSQCDSDEYPQHKVTVSSFAIDATEVTVSQYEECVSAGACTGSHCGGGSEHPVACVE